MQSSTASAPVSAPAGAAPAGLLRRSAAAAIDFLILALLRFALELMIGLLSLEVLLWPAWTALGSALVGVVYFAAFEGQRGGGASPGKWLLGLRVADRAGRPIAVWRAALRAVLLSAPAVVVAFLPRSGWPLQVQALLVALSVAAGLLAAYLYLFNRRSGLALHDLLTGTCVLRGAGAAPPRSAWPMRHRLAGGLIALFGLGTTLGLYLTTGVWQAAPALDAMQAELLARPEVRRVRIEPLVLRVGKRWQRQVVVAVSSRAASPGDAPSLEVLAAALLPALPAIGDDDSLSLISRTVLPRQTPPQDRRALALPPWLWAGVLARRHNPQARQLLERAGAGGRGLAADALVAFLLSQKHPQDIQQAVKVLERGAVAGDAADARQVGELYREGVHGALAADPQQAAHWLDLAVRHGDGMAALLLSMMVAPGGELPADLPRSMRLMQLAWKRGVRDATLINNLAWTWATAPDAALRDPAQALAYARRLKIDPASSAAEAAGLRDTLAAALAANGQRDQAVKMERLAVQGAGTAEQRARMQVRLRCYEGGGAWISAGVASPASTAPPSGAEPGGRCRAGTPTPQTR